MLFIFYHGLTKMKQNKNQKLQIFRNRFIANTLKYKYFFVPVVLNNYNSLSLCDTSFQAGLEFVSKEDIYFGRSMVLLGNSRQGLARTTN
jgi:hypothetical protein